jgi:2-succinyl-5-enolpyruvyl-6-hydroxy-3-cyclohexene-1-carboxylate synthase
VEWPRRWHAVDAAAERAIGLFIDGQKEPSEPGIVRAVFTAARPRSVIVVSSSMPVRDLEWFGAQRESAPTVISNRGANGIDGVTSTALGVATAANRRGTDVIAVVGDLAFLYDLSGLVIGVHEEVPDVTFVVVDNAGGGIFSFLPYPGVVDNATFERAFGTPQRPDIAETVRALGHTALEVTTVEEISRAVGDPTGGITVVIVRTDRATNVEIHSELGRRIVGEVERALADGVSS